MAAKIDVSIETATFRERGTRAAPNRAECDSHSETTSLEANTRVARNAGSTFR